MLSREQALSQFEEDIRLRGLAERTRGLYLVNVSVFLRHCDKPIEELDVMDARNFLAYLHNERHISPSAHNVYSAAIRFFFAVTLNKTLNYLQIPRMKVPHKFPAIASREDIAAILQSCTNSKYRAIFLLAYGSGLRVDEIAHLRVSDIDSKAMRILVSKGKGSKHRFTILSHVTLEALRQYWREYRPKSSENWVFLSNSKDAMQTGNIEHTLKKLLLKVGITKHITPHTLRHAFASHLLEDGYSIYEIKELLGHNSINSTAIYLHIANLTGNIVSPADKLLDNG